MSATVVELAPTHIGRFEIPYATPEDRADPEIVARWSHAWPEPPEWAESFRYDLCDDSMNVYMRTVLLDGSACLVAPGGGGACDTPAASWAASDAVEDDGTPVDREITLTIHCATCPNYAASAPELSEAGAEALMREIALVLGFKVVRR